MSLLCWLNGDAFRGCCDVWCEQLVLCCCTSELHAFSPAAKAYDVDSLQPASFGGRYCPTIFCSCPPHRGDEHCVASTAATTFDCFRKPLRQVLLGCLSVGVLHAEGGKWQVVGCWCSSFAQRCCVRVMRIAPSGIPVTSWVHGYASMMCLPPSGMRAFHHFQTSFAQS